MQGLARIWSNWKSHTLWVDWQIGTTTLENYGTVYESKNMLFLWPSNSALRYLPIRNRSLCSPKDMGQNVPRALLVVSHVKCLDVQPGHLDKWSVVHLWMEIDNGIFTNRNPSLTMWTVLTNIAWRERRQTHKIHTRWSHPHKVQKWMALIRGQGRQTVVIPGELMLARVPEGGLLGGSGGSVSSSVHGSMHILKINKYKSVLSLRPLLLTWKAQLG